jgi:hypothetical protein
MQNVAQIMMKLLLPYATILVPTILSMNSTGILILKFLHFASISSSHFPFIIIWNFQLFPKIQHSGLEYIFHPVSKQITNEEMREKTQYSNNIT